jgi:hypothetical protein
MEVIHDNGEIQSDHVTVLESWRNSFRDLLNPVSNSSMHVNDCEMSERTDQVLSIDERMSTDIDIDEVRDVVARLKNGKACGVGGIAGEILKVDCDFITRNNCIQYLNYDIMGIAETHLKGHEKINVTGYK